MWYTVEEIASGLTDYLLAQIRNEDAQELRQRELAKSSMDSQTLTAGENITQTTEQRVRSYEALRTQKLQIVADLQAQNDGNDTQEEFQFTHPTKERDAQQGGSPRAMDRYGTRVEQDMDFANPLPSSIEPLANIPPLSMNQAIEGPSAVDIASESPRLPSPPPLTIKTFLCKLPGCNTAPFETQDLFM